jgi:hypothetical protein
MQALDRKNRVMPSLRPMLLLLNLLCAGVTLIVISGCDSGKPMPVPHELLGTWRTQDPRYSGLFFKIDPDNFSFSTVQGTVENYTIVNYEPLANSTENRVHTHVLYGSRDGQKLKVSLIYDSLDGGRFKFKNQDKTFWIRDDGQKQ